MIKLTKVCIHKYKCIESDQEYEIDENVTVLVGMNESGKTSILEAIFLLGFGKSFLGVRKEEVKFFNSEGYVIKALAESSLGKNQIINSYFKEMKIYLNDLPIKLAEMSKYFFPVIFTSHDFARHIERKSFKRKLFNRFIFGVEDLYLYHLKISSLTKIQALYLDCI